jgi:hypothetical protein
MPAPAGPSKRSTGWRGAVILIAAALVILAGLMSVLFNWHRGGVEAMGPEQMSFSLTSPPAARP